MRIAMADASPAPSAERRASPRAPTSASVQNAAAGTSLIGETTIARMAGLVATSQAAASPAAGVTSRRPIANVAQMRSPA